MSEENNNKDKELNSAKRKEVREKISAINRAPKKTFSMRDIKKINLKLNKIERTLNNISKDGTDNTSLKDIKNSIEQILGKVNSFDQRLRKIEKKLN